MERNRFTYLIPLCITAGLVVAGVVYAAERNEVSSENMPPGIIHPGEYNEIFQTQEGEGEQMEKTGRVIEAHHEATVSADEIDATVKSFYGNHSVPNALYDVGHYTLTYETETKGGKRTQIVSQLFIPLETNQPLPVYVFGSGTTGLDDRCAPSKEIVEDDNWGNYKAHMLSYAGQGFAVMFPDYDGHNDGEENIHYYFIAEIEAKVMLDAARAVYDFFNRYEHGGSLKDAVFLAGYSQGGHATFAARDYHSYAADVPIKGIIGYGATTDVVKLFDEASYLGPYILRAYRDYYEIAEFDLNLYLQPAWQTSFETDTTTKCITEVGNYYKDAKARVLTPEFTAALENGLDGPYNEIKEKLEANRTGISPSSIPSLVLQGSIDPIVSKQVQDEFVKLNCDAGNPTTYIVYNGVHHFQTRQVSFQDTLDWMEKRLNEEVPSAVCEEIQKTP